jgi:hypothetical protein
VINKIDNLFLFDDVFLSGEDADLSFQLWQAKLFLFLFFSFTGGLVFAISRNW